MDLESKIAIVAIAVGAAATLLAVPLGWTLNRRQQRQHAAEAEREAVKAQADELASAVMALRISGHANDRLWNGPAAVVKLVTWAGVQVWAGFAQSVRPGMSAWMAGLGRAAELVARQDEYRNRSAATLTDPMNRVIAATMPLARHPDPAVSAATDQLMDAVLKHLDQDTLDARLRSFRQAIQQATEPPPAWYQRLRRRRGTPSPE